jgi:hypothetical protein
MVDDMEKLKKLGFKKVPGTEPGFHMYELTPATLRGPVSDTKSFGRHREASSQISSKPQASSLRRYVADTKSKK